MHPVVATALVVAVIGSLAAGGWPQIAAVSIACLLVLPAVPALTLGRLARTVWRLRFFYLSLAVLYAWFTPGEPLLPTLGGFSPNAAGLLEGMRHIAVLVVIVVAVQLFMASVARGELVAALRWWLRPLRGAGVDADRAAMRLMLVADLLPRLRQLAEQSRPQETSEPAWRRLARGATTLLERTLHEAENAPLPTLELPVLDPPGPRHWLPLLAAVALLSLL